MAIKAINNSARLDKIIFTFLIFGAYPQMTEMDTLSPSVIKRAEAIYVAIKKVRCL